MIGTPHATVAGAQRTFLIATIALLVFVGGSSCYRAATQSFTSVEQATHARLLADLFNRLHQSKVEPFLPAGTGSAASPSGNQSRFGELASGAAVKTLGLSEFTLRLPDVAGGLLYLTAIFLLCRLAFGDSAWLLLAVALCTLSPFLLDDCSIAARHGLGLGLWTFGAYFVVRWVADHRPIPIAAGLALGLGAAADSQQSLAVAALAAGFVGCVVFSRLAARDGRGAVRFVIRGAAPLFLASAFTAAVFSGGTGWLSFGDHSAPRLLVGVNALTSAFLLHTSTILTSSPSVSRFLIRLGWLPVAVVLIGLCLVAGHLVVGRLRQKPVEREGRLLILFAAVSVAMAALVWAEPNITGEAYFAARGLAFTQPVMFLSAALLLRWVQKAGQRALATLGMSVAGLLLGLFAFQFQLHSYYGLESESATRTLVSMLQERHALQPEKKVVLALPANLTPALNGYRILRELDWVAELPEAALECRADFYYLPEEQFGRLSTLGLRAISRDRVAGTVLAEIGPEAHRRLAALREVGFSDIPQCKAGVMAESNWIDCAKPGVARHLLRDFEDQADYWRWTHRRPAMLFLVARGDGVRFKMDFVLHRTCFEGRLPVELTVLVNGKEIGKRRYASLGNQTFEQPVPGEVLRSDGIALVETELDKYCTAAEQQRELGYMFLRGGFLN